MAHELFPEEVARTLPPLYSQDGKCDEAIAHVKFFTPDSNWTWYATEYDPVEKRFFGLVFGFEEEFGYFMLDELKQAKGPLGLPIERDIHFIPQSLKEIRQWRVERGS